MEDTGTLIDFDAHYTVDGFHSGIAFYLIGYHVEYGDVIDDWEEAEEIEDRDRVVAVMVGDDRRHIIDVSDLKLLEEDAYCSCCGQVGCGWG